MNVENIVNLFFRISLLFEPGDGEIWKGSDPPIISLPSPVFSLIHTYLAFLLCYNTDYSEILLTILILTSPWFSQ